MTSYLAQIDTQITSTGQEPTITEIMRAGRIARLLCDWDSPRWGQVRSTLEWWTGKPNPPQTVVFNERMVDAKGSKIPLTSWMKGYMRSIQPYFDKMLIPEAGWINNGIDPEALTWAANDVVVKSVSNNFANVHAVDCQTRSLKETFFTPNGRLVIHEFNAVTPNKTLIGFGDGLKIWTPFMKDSTSYWIPESCLEYWPALPKIIRLETRVVTIVEYLLLGYETYAFTNEGERVLLHNPSGYKSPDWVLKTPIVPF